MREDKRSIYLHCHLDPKSNILASLLEDVSRYSLAQRHRMDQLVAPSQPCILRSFILSRGFLFHLKVIGGGIRYYCAIAEGE